MNKNRRLERKFSIDLRGWIIDEPSLDGYPSWFCSTFARLVYRILYILIVNVKQNFLEGEEIYSPVTPYKATDSLQSLFEANFEEESHNLLLCYPKEFYLY